jgi:hypothetical protein
MEGGVVCVSIRYPYGIHKTGNYSSYNIPIWFVVNQIEGVAFPPREGRWATLYSGAINCGLQ